MEGYLALVLHAHLPFVRHPEHEKFLEETWLFEAVTETYLPLLQVMEGWHRDRLKVRLTLSLSPTLGSMLRDPILLERYLQHLCRLIELAENEIRRTQWEKDLQPLAQLYHRQFVRSRQQFLDYGKDLVAAFARFQEAGILEIIACAATHALLPLLQHPPSIRAQILTGRDFYRQCFSRDPLGIWLPECAYSEGMDLILQEANIRWFILDAHGLLQANPRPRYRLFAPIFTPSGVAAFGRDFDSAKQVWSKQEGYPGDPAYRDFYRDIGYDLDFDYLKPYLPSSTHRSFTGIKYYSITGSDQPKELFHPLRAAQTARRHANDFFSARAKQIRQLAGILPQPPLVLCPYDAELFGHWWYEGPEFLDALVRLASEQEAFEWITPAEYLRRHPSHQIAAPCPSSWGQDGYWRTWLNETNAWILPHLQVAQERMSRLVQHAPSDPLTDRALKQAARELLLAQASDWPFILRTGTSADYARQRVTDHLCRFTALHDQITSNQIDQAWLSQIEALDNLFPDVNYTYWA